MQQKSDETKNETKIPFFLFLFFSHFLSLSLFSIYLLFFLFRFTAHRSGSPSRRGSQNAGSCDSSELHVSAYLFIRNRISCICFFLPEKNVNNYLTFILSRNESVFTARDTKSAHCLLISLGCFSNTKFCSLQLTNAV